MIARNQHGQSLVQILVSIAIGGIVLMSVLTTQTHQARENRALQEKLAALDLQRVLTATIGDSNVCGHLIEQLSDKTFDASLITAKTSPPPIDLGKILPTSGQPDAPAIATVGSPASPISENLIVQAILLANIKCPAPCKDPKVSNQFTADLEVTFDKSRLIRTIQTAKSQVVLTTSSDSATKTITNCSLANNSTSPSGDFVIWY